MGLTFSQGLCVSAIKFKNCIRLDLNSTVSPGRLVLEYYLPICMDASCFGMFLFTVSVSMFPAGISSFHVCRRFWSDRGQLTYFCAMRVLKSNL
jgi:hypothetical protein